MDHFPRTNGIRHFRNNPTFSKNLIFPNRFAEVRNDVYAVDDV